MSDLPPVLRRWPQTTVSFADDLPLLESHEGTPLPAEASERLVGRLCQGLGSSDTSRLRKVCSYESLSRLAGHCFEAWVGAGVPDEGRWVFRGLVTFGSEPMAHQVGALVSRWGRQGRMDLAVQGLEVLRRLASDAALLRLLHLKVRGAGALRQEAADALEQIAASRGQSLAALEATIVPDVDLDDSGRHVLDLGSRVVSVSFDELLSPRLTGADGGALKSFPRKRKDDDPHVYDDAKGAWDLIRKTAKTLASIQIGRLERAMCQTRVAPWGREDFVETFVDHRLLRHLASRLVWAALDETDGSPTRTLFRVAEDGTFTDVDDEQTSLPPGGAGFTPAHPVHFGRPGTIERWRELFDDYDLLQPFEQLARDHYSWPEASLRAARLSLCDGWSVRPARLVALCRRGWHEGGGYGGFVRELRRTEGELTIILSFQPEYTRAALRGAEPVTLNDLELHGWNDPEFSDLSEVVRSEVLRDLHSLKE